MTRHSTPIALLFALCLGLWSCIASNNPPTFRDVSLIGQFSANDSALPFSGAIQADAGGLQLNFRAFQGATEITERFELIGKGAPANSTYWDLARDANLRLVNRFAKVGTYELLLTAVDADGVSDTLRLPVVVAGTPIQYTDWTQFWFNLSLESYTGIDLDSNAFSKITDSSARNATFVLGYQQSTGPSGDLSWMELTSPARVVPAVPMAAYARDDVRFLDLSSSFDVTTPPAQVRSLLDSKGSLDASIGLTRDHVIALKSQSGLVALLKIGPLNVDKTTGSVLLTGWVATPIH